MDLRKSRLDLKLIALAVNHDIEDVPSAVYGVLSKHIDFYCKKVWDLELTEGQINRVETMIKKIWSASKNETE